MSTDSRRWYCDNVVAKWISSLPEELKARLPALRARECGFGAGPGCCAGEVETFAPPVPIDVAIGWCARYVGVLRRAHVKLDDGGVLWFERDGLYRYDAAGAVTELGLEVAHAAEQGADEEPANEETDAQRRWRLERQAARRGWRRFSAGIKRVGRPGQVRNDQDLYVAVIDSLRRICAVTLWMSDDWALDWSECACGYPRHVRVHWRATDGSATGDLLLHGGYTRLVDCGIDPTPQPPYLGGLQLAEGQKPGFTMTVVDGRVQYVVDAPEAKATGDHPSSHGAAHNQAQNPAALRTPSNS